ncbi:MAG: hypothetical protein HQ513_15080 [Rhodospirillales bacterium]|nr:hypothetical protein [Rhodospirillales bacterium]
MPSKDKVEQQANKKGNEARPFTVFFVNPGSPEEVHTDTFMATDCEHASLIAAQRHRANTILHVRGIGDSEFSSAGTKAANASANSNNHFPCARFINGKFHQATFNDDQLLETLSE